MLLSLSNDCLVNKGNNTFIVENLVFSILYNILCGTVMQILCVINCFKITEKDLVPVSE